MSSYPQWHNHNPTPNQLKTIERLGYKGEPPTNKLRAKALIDLLIQQKNNQPPTQKQLNYLERLGYAGEQPDTKQEAGQIIEAMLSQTTPKMASDRHENAIYDAAFDAFP